MISYRKQLLYLILLSVLCTLLKMPYLDTLVSVDAFREVEQVYLLVSENVIANIIWIVQIGILIFFITNQIIDKLDTFDHRYKNRKTSSYRILKKFFCLAITFTFLSFMTQLVTYGIAKEVRISLVESIPIFCIYQIIIIASCLCILCLYLMLHNVIIALVLWIIGVNVIEIVLQAIKVHVLQVVYQGYIIGVLLVGILLLTTYIRYLYVRKDFGGNDDEIRG